MQTQQCNFPITYNFPFQLQECWNSILCRKNVQKQHDKSLVRFRGRFRSASKNRPKSNPTMSNPTMQLHKIFSLLMSIRFFMYEDEIQTNYQEQKEISSQKFCIFIQSSHIRAFTNSELTITNPDPDFIQRLFSCWSFLRQNKVYTIQIF